MTKKIFLSEIIDNRPPLTIDESATVSDAARAMSGARKGGAILITREGHLVGIFTERDVVQRVVAEGLDPKTTKVGQVMTRELITASPEDHHIRALRLLVTANCRHLPVVEGRKLVGMVSRRQLLAVDVETLEEEIQRYDPALLYAFP
jgi:signal-transduction protein with cAMP-binding, CBS, and nucleotidyltransferase domain